MTTRTDTLIGENYTATFDLDWLRRSPAAAISRYQTAQVLNIDPRTVTRAIESGELPSVRVGGRLLIPRLPLLRLLGAEPVTAESAAI